MDWLVSKHKVFVSCKSSLFLAGFSKCQFARVNLLLEFMGKMALWRYKFSMSAHRLGVEHMYSLDFLIETAANFIHSERN